jgi:hypothetical protein
VKLAASRLVPNAELMTALVDSERRLSDVLVNTTERVSDRAILAVDRAAGWTVEGLEALAAKAAWADDLMVVGALRKVQAPVAQLSLGIATKLNDASRELVQRVAGHTAVKAAARVAKAPSKSARRAARKAI